MEKHRSILVGSLIQLITFPGSVAIQSGYEIGEVNIKLHQSRRKHVFKDFSTLRCLEFSADLKLT
jgi:hypothetical protein